MGENFSKIKNGVLFTTSDGETFRKTSALTFDDMAGIEHYIDPFLDKKIGVPEDIHADVDTTARMVVTKPNLPLADNNLPDPENQVTASTKKSPKKPPRKSPKKSKKKR